MEFGALIFFGGVGGYLICSYSYASVSEVVREMKGEISG